MHILLTETWTLNYYMTDPSYRQRKRPTKNKKSIVLTTIKTGSRVPEWLNAKRLTDRPNDRVTDRLTDRVTDRPSVAN